MSPDEKRFWSLVDKTGDCWLWNGSKRKGYGSFYARGKTHVAHRWIYERIHGKQPSNIDACHRCDVRSCVNPTHLFAGTRSQNMLDMHSKNRHPRDCFKKPAPEYVIRLLGELSEVPNAEAAQLLGVSRDSVWNVRNGRAWRRVTGLPKSPPLTPGRKSHQFKREPNN